MDPIEEFLAEPITEQLRWIGALTPEAATALHNATLKKNIHAEVLAGLLERASPEEYLGAEQDPDLRDALTPESLARVRQATYDSQLRPLLLEPQAGQLAFVGSLNSAERAALLQLLDRYAREFGRSHACRNLETLIHEHDC